MREDELKLLKQMDPTDLINSTLKFQTLGKEDEWKLTLGIHLFPVLVSRLGPITDSSSSSPSPGVTADILHHYTTPSPSHVDLNVICIQLPQSPE